MNKLVSVLMELVIRLDRLLRLSKFAIDSISKIFIDICIIFLGLLKLKAFGQQFQRGGNESLFLTK